MFDEIDVKKIVNCVNEANKAYSEKLGHSLEEILEDGDPKQTSANITKHFNIPIILKIKDEIEEKYPGRLQKPENANYDFLFDGMEIEVKCTKSQGGWTGNTHSNKASYHLFIYYEIDENYSIKDMSIYFTNIDILQESSWKGESKSNSSWAGFKFHVKDLNKVEIIRGDIKKKKKWTIPILKEDMNGSQ